MSSANREIVTRELVVSKGIKLGQDNCMVSRINPFDIGPARVESSKHQDDGRNCLVFSFRQDTGDHETWGYMSSDPD